LRMSETPASEGMGPEESMGSSRSHHRNRKLVIIGAIALVLVAGTALAGSLTSGSRSGAATTVGSGDSCFIVQDVTWNDGTTDPEMTWQAATDAASAKGFRLPTMDELRAMLTQRASLNVNGNYWSSESKSANMAYHMDLSAAGDGEIVYLVKDGTLHVRPVVDCSS